MTYSSAFSPNCTRSGPAHGGPTIRTAWPGSMVLRRLLDEPRRGWARVRLSAPLPERPVVDPDPLDRIAMTQALRELPARQRAVLVLRYLMDLDVAATAEAMGCSEGTVKSQASRGLANL